MGAVSDLQEQRVGHGAFTWRSVLLGVLMCFIVGIADPWWTFYLHSSTLFLDYSVGGVMFFLFVLVLLINGTLALAGKLMKWEGWSRIALSSGELVVVAAMMLVAGGITSMGLTGYLIPNMTSPYCLADDQNKWEQNLWPYLPTWASPLDKGGGTQTIMLYYKGMGNPKPLLKGSWWSPAVWVDAAKGFVQVTKAMPWKPWLRPLALWGIFLMALYACMISIMAIVRKQWVDYERLTYPIAQVPQELCATAAAPWDSGSLFRSIWFWLGFAVPFIFGSINALLIVYHKRPIPQATGIPELGPIQLPIRLSFAVLGFTFLIPNRVAFSLWFLNLCSFAFRSVIKEYDWEMREYLGLYGASEYPIMAHQGMGAMLVLVLASLYFSREHLKKVVQCALGVGARGYDENEPSSYRLALLALVVSTVVMVIWLTISGLPVMYSFIFVAVSMLIFYGLTRVVTQCGVSVTIAPMIAPSFMVSTFGGRALQQTGVVTLTEGWTWMSDIRTSVMGSAAHGMYLSRKKGGGMFWLMLLAALVGLVVSCFFTIWLGYRYGAANLHGWFFVAGPPYTFKWGLKHMMDPQPPVGAGFMWTAIGAGIMGLLVLAQRSLFWWPVHPVGFIICSVTWTDQLWASIFLAWIVKLVIAKIGGNRLLRTARLFFLGMVLGQFTVAGVWAMYDVFANFTDHSIFWI